MEIIKDLKPLYASLKRLHIGYYLESSHFSLFCLENDWDDEWEEAKKWVRKSKSVLILGGPHYPSDEQESFILMLSEWHYNRQDYSEFLILTLLNFARWHETKLDLNPVYENLKDLNFHKENLLDFAKEYKKIRDSKPFEATKKEVTKPIPHSQNEVFIVHGHDNEAKTEVARFVEKLGLNSIILHEQASESATVIEKIEKHTNVGFGIILYTSCDVGNVKSKPNQLNERARQNVIFEHGFLIGKIGRKNVTALVKGDIETPSDISGVVYTKMDNANGWQLTLAKEMKAQGLDVDLNRL